MLGITNSLVERQSVAIDQLGWLHERVPRNARLGPDSKLYAKHGVGLPLVAVPAYLLGIFWPGSEIAQFAGYDIAPVASVRLVMLINAVITLLTALGVWRLVRILGFSERTAALTTAGFALGTMAWPYAKTFFSGPLTALGLTWAVVWTLEYEGRADVWRLLAGGVALSAAIVARPSVISLVPIFVILVAIMPRMNRHSLVSRLGAFSFALLPGIVTVAAYNFLRFSDLLQTGYQIELLVDPPWEGLLANLVSPSRGIFWFNPILLLSLPGAWMVWRKTSRDTALLSALIIVHVGLTSSLGIWDAGWSWGPRFLLPILPIATALAAPLWARTQTGTRALRAGLLVLILVSVGVQLVAAGADWSSTYHRLLIEQGITWTQLLWSPGASLIPAQLSTLLSSPPDSWLFAGKVARSSIENLLWAAAVVAAVGVVWRQTRDFPAR